MGDRIVVFVAQGFGSGWIRPGPGTWGSLVGLAWLVLLLRASHPAVWALGTFAGLALAVPLCGRAETVLKVRDPGSVVLDEIAAVPLLWLGVLLTPGGYVFSGAVSSLAILMAHFPELAAGFVAFRVLDIAKPGPIRRVQRLPRGVGIVADDVLAGLGAAVVAGAVAWMRWS